MYRIIYNKAKIYIKNNQKSVINGEYKSAVKLKQELSKEMGCLGASAVGATVGDTVRVPGDSLLRPE